MGLHHLHRRKLIPEICELICHGKDFVSCSSKANCNNCFKICLTNPQYPSYNYPPPPSKIPPSFYINEEDDENHQQKISTYLILTLSLLAAIFFLVCCRLIYTKLRSRRRTTTITRSSTQQRQESHDVFLDEEQGPMMLVDHPIWYIRTQGLHNSIINSITICKYKKGEGLIEGTECSVCLNEFQDDENLRLLPKCYHAFHLPCIDTWLRSHTNCPLCRAPIVVNSNPSIPMIPSLDSIVVDSMENNGEGLENTTTSNSNGSDSEERELEIEEVVNVRPRRSISLDDTLVEIANINNLAIANVLSGESSGGDSDRILKVIGNENLATTSNSKGSSSSFRLTRNLKGVPSPMKRSRSYNGKYLLSWYSRSQRKPNASLSKIDM